MLHNRILLLVEIFVRVDGNWQCNSVKNVEAWQGVGPYTIRPLPLPAAGSFDQCRRKHLHRFFLVLCLSHCLMSEQFVAEQYVTRNTLSLRRYNSIVPACRLFVPMGYTHVASSSEHPAPVTYKIYLPTDTNTLAKAPSNVALSSQSTHILTYCSFLLCISICSVEYTYTKLVYQSLALSISMFIM